MYFGASSDLESVNKIITIFLYIKQSMFLDLTRKGWGFLESRFSEIPRSQADDLCSDFNSSLPGSAALNKLLVLLQTSIYKFT